MQYNVSLEINVEAENPLEAAKLVSEILEDNSKCQFYVQEEGNTEIFSVDLQVDDKDAIESANYYLPIIKAN